MLEAEVGSSCWKLMLEVYVGSLSLSWNSKFEFDSGC